MTTLLWLVLFAMFGLPLLWLALITALRAWPLLLIGGWWLLVQCSEQHDREAARYRSEHRLDGLRASRGQQ